MKLANRKNRKLFPFIALCGAILYNNDQFGFSLDVPDSYNIEEQQSEVAMSFSGTVVVVVSHLSQTESDQRGLWADHTPVEEAQLDGRKANRYVYNHFDLLSGVRTISYVTPFEGKFLALEFRVRQASLFESFGIRSIDQRDLNEVQKRRLRSFAFRDDRLVL